MRKVLLTLIIVFSAYVSYGQSKVGTYNILGIERDIKASLSNNVLSVFIRITGKEAGEKPDLHIEGESNIRDFRNSLILAREKYIEWSKVAKENKVSDYGKMLDITFPDCNIFWKFLGIWQCSRKGDIIHIGFFVDSAGNARLLARGEAISLENDLISQEWNLLLSDIDSINSLIDGLDVTKIYKELHKKSETDKLFK